MASGGGGGVLDAGVAGPAGSGLPQESPCCCCCRDAAAGDAMRSCFSGASGCGCGCCQGDCGDAAGAAATAAAACCALVGVPVCGITGGPDVAEWRASSSAACTRTAIWRNEIVAHEYTLDLGAALVQDAAGAGEVQQPLDLRARVLLQRCCAALQMLGRHAEGRLQGAALLLQCRHGVL